MMNRVLRVGFLPIGGDQWMGGQNYLFNLVRALTEYSTDKVQPVLMVDHSYAPSRIADLEAAGVEVIRDDFFAKANQIPRLITALILGKDIRAEEKFSEACIDCVFENAIYHGWRFPVPTLHWIPDFQHRAMPHLFDARARLKRELGLRLASAKGRHIMLSSNDAKADFENYYRRGNSAVHVVPFAVPRPQLLPVQEIDAVARSLNIGTKWFFLPNQLWQHKNHKIVIEALKEARALVPDMVVVSTGSTSDPRNPEHHDDLVKLITDYDLGDAFHILGVIDYSDVQALMQGAIALINPSLFEGWSTVVEEAKSLSLPMILSNIDVHLEQVGNGAKFFNPDDPDRLTNLMVEAWSKTTPSCQVSSDLDAVEAFATSFAKAVQVTVDGE